MFILMQYLFLFTTAFQLSGNEIEERLQQANEWYKKGETATTFETQKEAFNHSLALYHSLESSKEQIAGLDRIIGDNYFQLAEYPLAILYYERALQNENEPNLTIEHLKLARTKLGINAPVSIKENEFSKILFSPKFLLIIILLTFFISSLAIWFETQILKKLSSLAFLVLSLLLFAHLFSYYTKPLEGIVIQTTGLFRSPLSNETQLTTEPLLAGTKVQIMQITSDENWVQISIPGGPMGYIPTANINVIVLN